MVPAGRGALANAATAIEIVHMRSYEPVRSTITPPSQAPKNEPTWCEKNTTPKSALTHCSPNFSAMIPVVGATVDNHKSPIADENAITENAVIGMAAKIAIVTPRSA
jgi:hypothetical protein